MWTLGTLQPLLDEAKRRHETVSLLHDTTAQLQVMNQNILYGLSRHKGWLERDSLPQDDPSPELAQAQQRIADLERVSEEARSCLASAEQQLEQMRS